MSKEKPKGPKDDTYIIIMDHLIIRDPVTGKIFIDKRGDQAIKKLPIDK